MEGGKCTADLTDSGSESVGTWAEFSELEEIRAVSGNFTGGQRSGASTEAERGNQIDTPHFV